MRKFLLVTLIGIVLVMDVYGVAKDVISYVEAKQQTEDMNGVATIVYVEE